MTGEKHPERNLVGEIRKRLRRDSDTHADGRESPALFLSYSPEDLADVTTLQERLTADGFDVWFDRVNLFPGQDWVREISRGIRQADYFLICLSHHGVERTGFLQREINLALELAEERRDGDVFVIPVRLEPCEVPPRLSRYQWIDLFEPNGYASLRRALRPDVAPPKVEFERIEALRQVLLEAFPRAQLRQLTFELPQARSMYGQLDWDASQAVVVNQMLRALERLGRIDDLVDWLARTRPDLIERNPLLAGPSYWTGISAQLPASLDNPYVVGNPVQPRSRKVFVGRFDIAHAIVGEIKKTTQRPSILLYGRRRMGKTSTLLNIGQIARDASLIHVYVSCQSAKFHTNRDFAFYLVQAVRDRLTQELGDDSFLKDGEFLTKQAFFDNPVLKLAEFFDALELFLESRNLHCLLAMDEYEELDRHLATSSNSDGTKAVTTDLLLELRNVLQHKLRVMFLMSGTHFLRELSGVDWSSLFINVRTLHVSFLSRHDGALLLTQPVPEMIYDDTSLVDDILDVTGCQPLLLQAMGSELVTRLNFVGSRRVTRQTVKAATADVLSKQNTYFSYLWDSECGSVGCKDLLKRIVKQGGALSMKSLQQRQDDIKELSRREVVRVKDDVVSATMPLFSLWLTENKHVL